jgi:thiol-disulfide isomerase/thioredoxin
MAQLKTVIDEKHGTPMLVGSCTRDAFSDTSYFWFNTGYDAYVPDSNAVQQLTPLLAELRVTIVMGSWCSDSKEHVPHFFKLIDELKFDEKNIHIICVDRNKKGLADEVSGLMIEKVPTFIFYKSDKEVGRIIETPEKSLEADLLSILINSK